MAMGARANTQRMAHALNGWIARGQSQKRIDWAGLNQLEVDGEQMSVKDPWQFTNDCQVLR